MTTPVLFDAPGPKARRNARILSAVAVVGLLFVGYLLLRRLDSQGQLEAELWAPLFDPRHEDFAQVWEVFGRAGLRNLQAAVIAMALSLTIGTALALTRVTAPTGVRWLVIGGIELFRGIPVVIAIFFAARALPELGIDLSTMWFLVIGLTAYNSVIIAEIVRSGLAAVPRGQLEAAEAVGLTHGQALRIVLLPQAVRIMLPALISQLVVILKDTSLGFIIGYEELLRTADRVGTALENPLQSRLLAAALFVIVCFSLGKLAEFLERYLSRATPTRPAAAEAETRLPVPVTARDAVTGA